MSILLLILYYYFIIFGLKKSENRASCDMQEREIVFNPHVPYMNDPSNVLDLKNNSKYVLKDRRKWMLP